MQVPMYLINDFVINSLLFLNDISRQKRGELSKLKKLTVFPSVALDDEKFGIDSYQDENGGEGEAQGGSDDPFEVVGHITICEI